MNFQETWDATDIGPGRTQGQYFASIWISFCLITHLCRERYLQWCKCQRMHQINMMDQDNSARDSLKTNDSSAILNFYKLRLEWNVTIKWNRNGPILIHNSNKTDVKWQCCVAKLDFYLSVTIRLFHRHRSKSNPTKLSLNSYDSPTTLNVYRPRRYSLQTLQPMLRFKINGCINAKSIRRIKKSMNN